MGRKYLMNVYPTHRTQCADLFTQALTESKPAGIEMKEFSMSCLVLTGTAPRVGNAFGRSV